MHGPVRTVALLKGRFDFCRKYIFRVLGKTILSTKNEFPKCKNCTLLFTMNYIISNSYRKQ